MLQMTDGLLLRFPEDLFHEGFVYKGSVGYKLAIFDEVDRVSSGNLLGVEGAETQECFTHHIRCQPMAIGILDLIPEEFLLIPDTINRHHQAAGK
jgi:hypothetical protein